MHRLLSICGSCYLVILVIEATSEWYGDQRAYETPNDAFYDITYDESACPLTELKSHAVPNYILFGPLVATLSVDDQLSCLKECLRKEQCRAVNYFRPLTYQRRGFCELLSHTQLDNPRAMHPYRSAVYLEHIRCRDQDYVTYENGENVEIQKPTESAVKTDTVKKLFDKVKEFNLRYRA